MPQIQPVVFPALSAGLIIAMASPCEPCLPLIRAHFLDVGCSSVSRKQEPFPRYSSTRQNLKMVRSFRGGEGKSEMFFGEKGAGSRNGTGFPACLWQARARKGWALVHRL